MRHYVVTCHSRGACLSRVHNCNSHVIVQSSGRGASLCSSGLVTTAPVAWNSLGCFLASPIKVLFRATTYVSAFSHNPHSMLLIVATAIDSSLNPPELISDAVKRSTKAHLFHFYAILCEIVAIPRKTPTAWVMSASSGSADADNADPGDELAVSVKWKPTLVGDFKAGKVLELDARQVAKDCLKELAQEMGISS